MNFLQSLPEGLFYFASIRSDTYVFPQKPKVGLPQKLQVLRGEPQAQTVAQISKSEELSWKSVVLAEGAKGPIVAEVARIRVYLSRHGLPEEEPLWLFIRRNADGQIKFALSNAPEDMPVSELCEASIMRCRSNSALKKAKTRSEWIITNIVRGQLGIVI